MRQHGKPAATSYSRKPTETLVAVLKRIAYGWHCGPLKIQTFGCIQLAGGALPLVLHPRRHEEATCVLA